MLEKGKKLDFDSKYNVRKDDKKYELSYNDKKADDIVKQASNITQKINKNVTVAPSRHQSVHVSENIQQRSQQVTHQVIGTEKTVTGQQTQNYVNNLATKFAQEQNQQNLIELAIEQTVNKFFESYDVDNNGYLSSTQLNRFVNEVASVMNDGAEISSDQIQLFVEEVDKDRDGKISKEELFRFIKRLLLSL